MLLFDMTCGRFIEPDTDQRSRSTEATLQPDFHAVRTELQAVQSSQPERWQSSPGVVAAGLEWLKRN